MGFADFFYKILSSLYSASFVLLLTFAIGYYKLAQVENASTLIWTVLSVGTYWLTWQTWHWRVMGQLFGQILLFAGITGYRAVRDAMQKK